MKPLLFAGLLLACALSLRANDILANGNFVDGTAHWHGDAHASTDWNNQGITIDLKSSRWTNISQVFNSKETSLNFSITYKMSPDCALGRTKLGADISVDDLADITETRFKNPIHINSDAWLLMINDPTNNEGTYYTIATKPGTSTEQTITGTIPNIAAHEEKTIFLIFPPGQGSITLLKIALTSTAPASQSPFPSP